MNETLMTDAAATTTEGADASQAVMEAPVPASAEAAAPEQQAPKAQSESPEKPAEQTKDAEDFTFTAPEGREFDSNMIETYTQAAKEAGMSKDAAQKLLSTIAPALAEKQGRMVEEAKTQWADATKSDKELGGDALEQNLGVARKALDTFGSQELKQLLTQSGLGNHPEVIRFFVKAGKAISEDGFVSGSRAPGADAGNNIAKRMFPNQA